MKKDFSASCVPAAGSGHRYLTYPHANGFADGGRTLVFTEKTAEGFAIWRLDLLSGAESRVCVFDAVVPEREVFWFDIATQANVLFAVAGNALCAVDMNEAQAGQSKPRVIYREPELTLDGLVSVSATADKVVFGRHDASGARQVMEMSLPADLFSAQTPSGKIPSAEAALGTAPVTTAPRVLAAFDWYANHYQISHFDPEWVGFCHEGAAGSVPDRIWGAHPVYAPGGRALLDNGALDLRVGHEVWAWHAASVFVVAYGESPGRPRGIYEVAAAAVNRPPRLVSEGDRDWHLNVSRCGRWVVADTTGSSVQSGCGWENANGVSDIIVIDSDSGERRLVASTRYKEKHPWHPHPVFSSNGEFIFFNSANGAGEGGTIAAVANPFFRKTSLPAARAVIAGAL